MNIFVPHITTSTIPPAPSLVDVSPVVTAVEGKIDELKKEQAASLKSFSEAVKASATTSPPAQKPSKKKASPKPPPYRMPGSLLPQAVVRYRGSIDNGHRPIYVKILESLNGALASSTYHKHVLVVGVKWTAGSNLVVRARAPSPTALVSALESVQEALEDDHRVINDIIPNTRWSRVTVSYVYSGKEPSSSAHSSSALQQEFAAHNPAYASLTIRQAPSWTRDPASFRDGQHSSVSFAFEDPDGSIANSLAGVPFTAFGNLNCPVKLWVRNKKPKKKAMPTISIPLHPPDPEEGTPHPSPASTTQVEQALGLSPPHTGAPGPTTPVSGSESDSDTDPVPGNQVSPMRPPVKRRKKD
jgi:hypothetical protein